LNQSTELSNEKVFVRRAHGNGIDTKGRSQQIAALQSQERYGEPDEDSQIVSRGLKGTMKRSG
jgi:hypothetical protein